MFVAVVLALVAGVSGSGTPRELGNVDWSRSFDTALKRARATGHPLFVLFQEVPGCNTCVSFGEQVLTHPLLVEAIEEEFVPVAIYNNRGGADRAVLERYGEQPWNNPVVRFLDSDGRDRWSRFTGGSRTITAADVDIASGDRVRASGYVGRSGSINPLDSLFVLELSP